MRKIKRAVFQFFKIFNLTLGSKFTITEKLSLLVAQLQCYLGVKIKLKKKVITINLMGFRISSFGYFNLLYQIREIFLLGEYEISTTKAAPIIIDCGANIGLSILYFKRKHPQCRIIAFEPNPDVFEILKLNISQNQLEGVQLFNYCLSEKEGEIEFFINGENATMEGSILANRGGSQKLNVKAVKLSSYITEQIDFIKMDIEGAETLVIEDLVGNGKLSSTKNYLIEYHHNIPSQKSALGRFIHVFEENGFGINVRTNFYNQGEFQDVFLRIFKIKEQD